MPVPAGAAITSEVGPLRELIVHRPGLELRRLTPANKADLLFDELVWVSAAQAEHDGFVDLLRAEGVTVWLFGDLLAETLEEADVRAGLIAQVATPDACGVELVGRVGEHLAALAPRISSPRSSAAGRSRRCPARATGSWAGCSDREPFSCRPVYRTLRGLERDALVESAWLEPRDGHARRHYRITDRGEAMLASWARTLSESRSTLDAYLDRYVATTGRQPAEDARTQ